MSRRRTGESELLFRGRHTSPLAATAAHCSLFNFDSDNGRAVPK